MNSSTSFRNFVPSIFAPAEVKLQRQRDAIAREELRIETDRGIATRYAALQDQLASAQQNFVRQCVFLDAFLQPPATALYVGDFLRGQKLSIIAADMSARAAFEVQIDDFKTELRKQLVSPAEKSLATFTANNKAVIAKLPKLERTAEPPFTPAPPAVEFSDWPAPQPPSAGVRLMLGLKIGETLPPGYEPKTSGQMINDVD
jgi:hypothetical protein